MYIIALRTDNPRAEVGLYKGTEQLDYVEWQAHRQLAETLHATIRKLLDTNGVMLAEIQGIAVYEGPGSFTGLRIGISVANALAASFSLPIVGVTDDDWVQRAILQLMSGKAPKQPIVPRYGAPVHITPQKK